MHAHVHPARPAAVDARRHNKSGGKLIGKCLVPLQPLLSACELTVSTPILTEGRREAGGSVEMSMRLRKPISSDEVVVTEVSKRLAKGSMILSPRRRSGTSSCCSDSRSFVKPRSKVPAD